MVSECRSTSRNGTLELRALHGYGVSGDLRQSRGNDLARAPVFLTINVRLSFEFYHDCSLLRVQFLSLQTAGSTLRTH
jgi:hypothetical protein